MPAGAFEPLAEMLMQNSRLNFGKRRQEERRLDEALAKISHRAPAAPHQRADLIARLDNVYSFHQPPAVRPAQRPARQSVDEEEAQSLAALRRGSLIASPDGFGRGRGRTLTARRIEDVVTVEEAAPDDRTIAFLDHLDRRDERMFRLLEQLMDSRRDCARLRRLEARVDRLLAAATPDGPHAAGGTPDGDAHRDADGDDDGACAAGRVVAPAPFRDAERRQSGG